ncbi:MAG: hypothetical protein VB817_13895, partial [Pirellulaceae bacterium]
MPDLSHHTVSKRVLLRVLLLCLLQPLTIAADEVADAIQVIAKTGGQARGSESAAAAVRRLTEEDISIVPRLLSAMDTPNIVAANWYRQAY